MGNRKITGNLNVTGDILQNGAAILPLPAIASGDAGKALIVNSAEDGTEWSDIGGGGAAELAESITYADLKTKRDGGTLEPGKWYRITDYEFVTTNSYSSANHPYDIIVRADSASTLDENAFAAKRAGDTYFTDDDRLESWKLKYDMTGSTTLYEWAPSTGHKGIVYRLIDQNGNDAPIDFKNALHSGYYLFSATDGGTVDYSRAKANYNCSGNYIAPQVSSRKNYFPRLYFLAAPGLEVENNTLSSFFGGSSASFNLFRGMKDTVFFGRCLDFSATSGGTNLERCSFFGNHYSMRLSGYAISCVFSGVTENLNLAGQQYNTFLGHCYNITLGSYSESNLFVDSHDISLGNYAKNNHFADSSYITASTSYIQDSKAENVRSISFNWAQTPSSSYPLNFDIVPGTKNLTLNNVNGRLQYRQTFGGTDGITFQLTAQTDLTLTANDAEYYRDGNRMTLRAAIEISKSSSADSHVYEIGRFKGFSADLLGSIPTSTAGDEAIVDTKAAKAFYIQSGFGILASDLPLILKKDASNNELVLAANVDSITAGLRHLVNFESTLLISPNIVTAAS